MAETTRGDILREKLAAVYPHLDERALRCWAAAEARACGRGGIAAVASATGMSPHTIRVGLRELQLQEQGSELIPPLTRVRRAGGGRPALTREDPGLLEGLRGLLEANTRGDPMAPLLWTCKSTRKLADELTRQGHPVSHSTVATLLDELGYSLQANRKTQEGKDHPDRDAQFQHINRAVQRCQRRGQPVISVDAKKKELLGNYKNGGREWHPIEEPEEVRSKDFPDKGQRKVTPYGVYDQTVNTGWVSVGVTHDTAEFAVATIRRWWVRMGRWVYPQAEQLLITADGGGSNGSRSRLWKVSIQRLADEVGLALAVCHFPPGTSKWNKIEHRMFSQITENWRGRPLRSHEVIINLIGNTKTKKGLRIEAAMDWDEYETGIKVPDEEIAALNIHRDTFHGDWNYTISPRPK